MVYKFRVLLEMNLFLYNYVPLADNHASNRAQSVFRRSQCANKSNLQISSQFDQQLNLDQPICRLNNKISKI